MSDVPGATMATRDLDGESTDRMRRAVQRARDRFVIGAVLTLAGFLLPWFKFRDSRWYNGWDLVCCDGGWWVTALAIGYVMLILGGSVLLVRGRTGAEWVAILSLAVLPTTWLVFGTTLAALAPGWRWSDSITWSPSVVLLIVGQAMMLWGALTVALLWSVGQIVTNAVE